VAAAEKIEADDNAPHRRSKSNDGDRRSSLDFACRALLDSAALKLVPTSRCVVVLAAEDDDLREARGTPFL